MHFSMNFVFILLIPSVLSLKTFYETDLNTTQLFNKQNGNQDNLCEELGTFYESRNERMSLSKCIRFKESQILYCHGDFHNFKNFSNQSKLQRIESLVICRHTLELFNPNLMRFFAKLKNLYIGNSSIEKFTEKLPKLDHLEFINITRTKLNSIKSDFFSELPSIKLIDLRFNRLFFIEKLQLSNADVKVFLFGNFWDCTKNLKWIATNDYKFDIIDKEMMNCSDQKYRARPILTVMNYKMILSKSCQQDPELRNCSCHISYLRLDIDTNTFHPMFSVNCSNAGFYEFPRQLPVNTTTLFISNNQITSLNMLCTRNSTYGGIHDMYLDYNQISDVSVLDNCEWFLNFRVLSLKGNLLEKIPNYAFRNSFEKSHHAVKLYLSDNPWLCDCKLQPRVLSLCQKYELIVDQKKIRCLSDRNDEAIYGRFLMQLTQEDVCKEKGFKLNTYEIMSIVFACLIILILSNLLYDYYLYKHYGKLPYLVLHTQFF